MPLSIQTLRDRLRRTARQLRWARSGRLLMSGLMISISCFLASLMLDMRFHLGLWGRGLGFVAIALPILVGMVKVLAAWRRPISDAGLARRIESACDGANNALIAALQLDSLLATEPKLRQAVFAEIADPFPRVRWEEVFDLKLLKKLGLTLAAMSLVLAASAMISPARFANSTARMLLPIKEIPPLTKTRITAIRPGHAQVVHGSRFAITAALEGEIPRVAHVQFREQGSSWQRSAMDHEAGQKEFTFAWNDVRQPLDFYVEAGDACSTPYHLSVRPRTAIRSRTAEIHPPAYTKSEPSIVRNFNILQNILPGSSVAITAEFNDPLESLRATDEKGDSLSVTKLTDTRWRLTDEVKNNQKIQLAFRDHDGLEDSDSFQIQVAPNEAPRVEIVTPPSGAEVSALRNTLLGIRFACMDRYGLGSVALYRGTGEGADGQLVQQWTEAASQRSFNGYAQIPLEKFSAPNDEKVAFVVVAHDQNNVTGPGITVSRTVTVSLRSPEKMQQQVDDLIHQLQTGLQELVHLQKTNLDESRIAAQLKNVSPNSISPLLNRQTEISEKSYRLAAFADVIAPRIRNLLAALEEKEMKEALLALRNAAGSTDALRGKFLGAAIEMEAAILIQLQGAPEQVAADAAKERIKDLLSGVDNLLHLQRDIQRDTDVSNEAAFAPISNRQDALADQSLRVRGDLQKGAANAPLGDRSLAERLQKVAAMFGEQKIYEEMLTAAERLQNKNPTEASPIQKRIIANLAKMLEVLNEWQIAHAQQEIEQMKKDAEGIKEKLAKLEAIQRDVLEKSKDLARKNEFRPEDLATAKQIKESKDQMLNTVEQMLTDAHVFPDLKPSNELRSELVAIHEDVQQTDKEEAAEGKLKPQEIAVQKEDSLLKEIEQAKKISEDMEMWLPNKLESQKWLCENFDKQEMPDIPNLPLPDAFEDVVGDLLKEQEGLNQQVADAASNQAFAQNPANGWEIRDGPMPGFGAQGKSGNERPNKNEQTGRSSGGREGMSNGEMVGNRASNLEGTPADARRTRDPLQQGSIKDDGGGHEVKATGGGKTGGFSDRQGMDGNAPLRGVNAPRQLTPDALATEQAMLAEKTSRASAKASLLYLRADGMGEAARLMEESQQALKEGRIGDFKSLHQQIVRKLDDLKDGLEGGNILTLPSQNSATLSQGDKPLLGGSEGDVPAQYKDMTADYFRALNEK